MRKLMLCVLCLFVHQFGMSQETRKSFDFIIVIDEEIAISLSKPLIVVKQGVDVLKRIDIDYFPGNLSLNSDDYDMIFSEQEITLFLQYDYYQYSSKGKQEIYNYEIEIGKNWFDQMFVILKVFNLDKKKYRKTLDPLSKDKNYTFDLETSQGQQIRVRNK